jgi:hypothetical protein
MIVHCEPDNPGDIVGRLHSFTGNKFAGVIAWTVRSPEVKKYAVNKVTPADIMVTLVLDREMKYEPQSHMEFQLCTSPDAYVGGHISPDIGVVQDGRVWIFPMRDVYGGRAQSNKGDTHLGNIYTDLIKANQKP